ncbi:hypothetical protein [Mariniphaga sediminis]|nr:hypothetical protein [Mariniphaga sediminis]
MKKKLLWGGISIAGLVIIVLGWEFINTLGRTQLQINIHQNKELIYLSTFAEPPQFAIWLEDPETHRLMTVFVTHRVAVGDWEGKANVPVALPRWFELFKVNKHGEADAEKVPPLVVTGATPKDDYFSVRAEVKPGSKWICWVEMNLAGDFNDAFPQEDIQNFKVDEFSNGQPALLYWAEVKAEEGRVFDFELAGKSIWDNGKTRVESVSEGITTAQSVFDEMNIEVIQPKPKLIDRNRM